MLSCSENWCASMRRTYERLSMRNGEEAKDEGEKKGLGLELLVKDDLL